MIQKFEHKNKTNGFQAVRVCRPYPEEKISLLMLLSSYWFWIVPLSSFTTVALMVLLKPGLLS